MTAFQMIIKNAKYYSEGRFFEGDIGVLDGKIVSITAPGLLQGDSDKTIDASGLHVLPGVVDSHVHFRDPSRPDREDFYTGSTAAAAGGVTTFCEMPLAIPPPNNVANLQNRINVGHERSMVDFALFGAAGFDNRNDFQPLIDAGVIAFKTFLHPAPEGRELEFDGLTVNDDGALYRMMEAGAETNGRYYFHCENAKLIAAIEQKLHEMGVEDYSFHYKSRCNLAETHSVATILMFAKATGCKVGIVHISAPEACELVKQAQNEGQDVVAETCFHYLTYHHGDIDKFGPYAKCNPPLRSKEDMEKLWDYVLDGTISYIGSDHAPFVPEEKEIGVREGIWRAYSGMPAVELLLPLMLTHVNAGRLTLEELTPLLTENTARIYGIFPQKGCIALGSDADFAIVDMNCPYTIRIEDMYCKSKVVNKLFDETPVTGKVKYTVVRGRVLMENGQVDLNNRGYGRFVRP